MAQAELLNSAMTKDWRKFSFPCASLNAPERRLLLIIRIFFSIWVARRKLSAPIAQRVIVIARRIEKPLPFGPNSDKFKRKQL